MASATRSGPQALKALERAILGNAGLAEEIRSRLYDAQDINDKLFDAAFAALRKRIYAEFFTVSEPRIEYQISRAVEGAEGRP